MSSNPVKSENLNNASPKTPGGISKSLLTPYRRVGLSRKWRKSGSSPFISPLSHNTDNRTENDKRHKRKQNVSESGESEIENCNELKRKQQIDTADSDCNNELKCHLNIVKTPTRHVKLPVRKKSKKLLIEVSENVGTILNSKIEASLSQFEDASTEKLIWESSDLTNSMQTKSVKEIETTPTLKKHPSKSCDKNSSGHGNEQIETDEILSDASPLVRRKSKKVEAERSPNNLTKECMIVIEKNILNKVSEEINLTNNVTKVQISKPIDKKDEKKLVSQALFDSDSDETPLSNLTKSKGDIFTKECKNKVSNDNDFIEDKVNTSTIVKKLDRKPSSGHLKPNTKTVKESKKKKDENVTPKSSQNSNSSFGNDDDDFDFDSKKTILIRKTYNKCAKPCKAKSTGSITQKDIDELKARIEVKKQLLLAKTMTDDTKELRDLVKRWRKGCQDALTELMDLMRKKFPEKHNMDYSELLEMLKIPSILVGYDENHDCFKSPQEMEVLTVEQIFSK